MESALPGVLGLRFFLPATSDFLDFIFEAAAFFGFGFDFSFGFDFGFAFGFGFGFALFLGAEDLAFLVAMAFVLSLC
jgi:hypothetical protein